MRMSAIAALLLLVMPAGARAWTSEPGGEAGWVLSSQTAVSVEGSLKMTQKFASVGPAPQGAGTLDAQGWSAVQKSTHESSVHAIGGAAQLVKDFQAEVGPGGEWSRIDVGTQLHFARSSVGGSLQASEKTALFYWWKVGSLLADAFERRLAWVRIGEGRVQIAFESKVDGTWMQLFNTTTLQGTKNEVGGKFDVSAAGVGSVITVVEAAYQTGRGLVVDEGGIKGAEQVMLSAFREFRGTINLKESVTVRQSIP